MRIRRFNESTDSEYKEFNLIDECQHIIDNDPNFVVYDNSQCVLEKLNLFFDENRRTSNKLENLDYQIQSVETFSDSLKELNILLQTFKMRGFTATLEESKSSYELVVLDTDEAFKLISEDTIEVNKETLKKRLSNIVSVLDISLYSTSRGDKIDIKVPPDTKGVRADIMCILYTYSILEYIPTVDMELNDSEFSNIYIEFNKKLVMK